MSGFPVIVILLGFLRNGKEMACKLGDFRAATLLLGEADAAIIPYTYVGETTEGHQSDLTIEVLSYSLKWRSQS